MQPNKFLYDKVKRINKSCKSVGKTKVKMSERKIYEPNIYHVYLEFENNNETLLSEIGKYTIFQVEHGETKQYRLPNIIQSLDELREIENIHNTSPYILGINDCRHFCDRMLDSLYNFNEIKLKF